MNVSRMMFWTLILAVLVTMSGCALHSELDLTVKGRYQPTFLSPPQVADVHTTWKVSVN